MHFPRGFVCYQQASEGATFNVMFEYIATLQTLRIIVAVVDAGADKVIYARSIKNFPMLAAGVYLMGVWQSYSRTRNRKCDIIIKRFRLEAKSLKLSEQYPLQPLFALNTQVARQLLKKDYASAVETFGQIIRYLETLVISTKSAKINASDKARCLFAVEKSKIYYELWSAYLKAFLGDEQTLLNFVRKINQQPRFNDVPNNWLSEYNDFADLKNAFVTLGKAYCAVIFPERKANEVRKQINTLLQNRIKQHTATSPIILAILLYLEAQGIDVGSAILYSIKLIGAEFSRLYYLFPVRNSLDASKSIRLQNKVFKAEALIALGKYKTALETLPKENEASKELRKYIFTLKKSIYFWKLQMQKQKEYLLRLFKNSTCPRIDR